MNSARSNRILSLKNISIVVPTYSRKDHLLRTLEFINSYNFGHVIVVDGTPGIDLTNQVASKFPGVTYIHSEAGFVNRIAMTIPLVQTEYVALWGDDEYWLPSFFSNAVEYLSNNPEYVHCVGLAVSFDSSPSIRVMPQYPEMRNLQLRGKTPSSRLYSRFRNYVWGGLWGLSRTSTWVKSWAAPAVEEFPIRGATEIQFEAGMSWQGRVKVLQELSWFRSAESTSIDSSADVSLHRSSPLFHEWWIDASQLEQRRFIESFHNVSDLEPRDIKAFARALTNYSLSVARPGVLSGIPRAAKLLAGSISKLAMRHQNTSQTREANSDPIDVSLVIQLDIEDFLGLSVDRHHLSDLRKVLNSLTSFVEKSE